MDDNRTNDTLTDKQVRVIPFLLEAPTIEDGCKRARVAKATFYGWLKQEAFKKEFERQSNSLYNKAMEGLNAGTNRAVERLLVLVESRNENIALRAVQTLLSFAIRAKEASESRRAEDHKSKITLFSLDAVSAAWDQDEKAMAEQRKTEIRVSPSHRR